MSTTPVTLDFSKAQPIDSGGVQLDFSKAQPLSTDQALSQAAATVAKPTPKTDANGVVDPNTGIDPVERMRDVPGKIISALTPDDMPQPHKDFGVDLDRSTGRLKYTYPAGQKEFDPNHPEMSTDDEGNLYYQGNKVPVKIGMVVPTPGVGLPTAGTMAQGAKTAADAFKSFLQSDAAKEGAKFIAKHALKGAASAITGGGTLIGLAKLLGYF